MRKIILYIATSLDGYIADKTNGLDFLGVMNPEDTSADFAKLMDRCDTVIMGKTTYLQVINELSPDYWPHEEQTTYVLTGSKVELKKGVQTFDGDIRELVKQLNDQKGKDIFLVGGANTIGQFIEYNLVDEYEIFVFPIILGAGVKLWPNNVDSIVLQHKETTTYGNDAKVVKVSYER